jgi:hypothetical protein
MTSQLTTLINHGDLVLAASGMLYTSAFHDLDVI